ncbi:heavy metal sensor histidine kinase [Paraburkholderia antibiotica]|uniref:Sensor protein n=1 Tax=Paraburkholderia antibiotica TaxID=2728839 RepID=A0A7X9ZVU2_9BURK|nr:heavy metal sensor histidine kinase [Paraburkholderia antibiotica]NML30504.1 heavy metal sensor histidine kinase [Paraburkholderia antibiotica]
MLCRFVPRTLGVRLTIMFALASSILLAANGLCLYAALKKNVMADSEQEIHMTLGATLSRLANEPSEDAVARQDPVWFDPFHAHDNIEMAIYARDGRQLVRSSGFRLEDESLIDPATGRAATANWTHDGFRYVSALAPLASEGPDAKARKVNVVVQYDYSRQRALLRTYSINVMLVTLLGTFVSALVAYSLARLGLRPLKLLAERADQVSSSKLTQPLPDISMTGEMLALNQAFNRMLKRLNESFDRLSRFSADLAHDMRTPLANMLAESQVALSRPREAHEYRAVIESSIDETQRLSGMIEDMLFLARSENRLHKIDMVKIDARAEAEQVAGYYEMLAADRNVTLQVIGDAHFDGNRLLVQRALSNLLSNALNHAPSGSEVVVQCSERGALSEIAVIDNGPGIGAEHIEPIFDRFYLVDPARHESTFGTGLGLAIVKSIMDEHRGSCSVTSEPGVRTAFVLSFNRSTD